MVLHLLVIGKTENGNLRVGESRSKVYFDYAERKQVQDRKAGLKRKTEVFRVFGVVGVFGIIGIIRVFGVLRVIGFRSPLTVPSGTA